MPLNYHGTVLSLFLLLILFYNRWVQGFIFSLLAICLLLSACTDSYGTSNTNQIAPQPYANQQSTGSEEWRTYFNTKIGLSFQYPATWKVEDNGGSFNLFSSQNPYDGEFLKKDVMKAQFSLRDKVGAKNSDDVLRLISEDGVFDEQNVRTIPNDNDVVITKVGAVETQYSHAIEYFMPQSKDYSKLINIMVWNEDSNFEKVLKTLKTSVR